jgi:hypothetical protein
MELRNFSITFLSPEDLKEKLEELLVNLATKMPEGSKDEELFLDASHLVSNIPAVVIYNAYDEL